VIRAKGHKGRKWRLAQRDDGACVFLNEQGLCRIHAKFGEAAKPIACRIYPYAFHPAGRKIAVGLRFSCPSVVKNLGRPVREQSADLKSLANTIVPEQATSVPAPEVVSRRRVEWTEFHKLNHALDDTFADPGAPFLSNLFRALTWVGLVEQSQLNLVDGVRIEDYLHAIRTAAAQDNPSDVRPLLPRVAAPSSAGRVQFRQLAGVYVRKDTFAAERGLRARVRLLQNILRLTRGDGHVPAIRAPFKEVPFPQLEQPFGELPAGAEEILTRYYRVKIQSLHYCGPAFHDRPFVEGFYSLALVYPCVMWIARWHAASAGRTSFELDDVVEALTSADHHHGYNRALGSWSARRRVKNLVQMGDVLKLCAWYSR
jgi:lysine-N-methylase